MGKTIQLTSRILSSCDREPVLITELAVGSRSPEVVTAQPIARVSEKNGNCSEHEKLLIATFPCEGVASEHLIGQA